MIVTSALPSPPPPPLPSQGGHRHRTHPPSHPSLDDDTLKTRPSKHGYSNKLSNTHSTSSNGALTTSQSARLETQQRLHLYTEDTLTVRGWATWSRGPSADPWTKDLNASAGWRGQGSASPAELLGRLRWGRRPPSVGIPELPPPGGVGTDGQRLQRLS